MTDGGAPAPACGPAPAPAPGRFVVPADHPALPGHFPGRPIVPGVVLLDAVFAAAMPLVPVRLLRAKFAAPVGPGEEVVVEFERRAPDRLGFDCRCRGLRVLWGELACVPPRQAALETDGARPDGAAGC